MVLVDGRIVDVGAFAWKFSLTLSEKGEHGSYKPIVKVRNAQQDQSVLDIHMTTDTYHLR